MPAALAHPNGALAAVRGSVPVLQDTPSPPHRTNLGIEMRLKGTTSEQADDKTMKTSLIDYFNAIFDEWAQQAVRAAGFPAAKPEQQDRIPDSVKIKIAQLWQSQICYPDTQPARFRILDGKRGGPYKWFSYFKSNQTIYPNWEYFVQVAAFHDLVCDYGYPRQWLQFEYNESVKPVSLSVDIGILFPDGRKAFVEVKERRDQWQVLLTGLHPLGRQGVDLNSSDRGNDPLRKAKYIVAGRPAFFVGYYPDSFEVYKVACSAKNRFTLKPAALPQAQEFHH